MFHQLCSLVTLMLTFILLVDEFGVILFQIKNINNSQTNNKCLKYCITIGFQMICSTGHLVFKLVLLADQNMARIYDLGQFSISSVWVLQGFESYKGIVQSLRVGVSKLRPAGRMRPSGAYYAALGGFVKVKRNI